MSASSKLEELLRLTPEYQVQVTPFQEDFEASPIPFFTMRERGLNQVTAWVVKPVIW